MNYVKLYKQAFGIEFSSDEYEVHHLDFDRSNNSLSNLLLLPKKLHREYHMRKDVFEGCPVVTKIQSSLTGYDYLEEHIKALRAYADTINECRVWMDYKDFLLGHGPNRNGIDLRVIK